MILIIAIIVAAVGIALIVEHFRFRARAQKVDAEVIEVNERESWSSTGSNSGSGRKVIQYIPVFQVTGPDGVQQRIEATEGSSSMNLPIGSRHKILIDPNNPGTGRPVNNNAFMWSGMCFAGAAFLFVMDWYDIMN